jgi:hypothetical protein
VAYPNEKLAMDAIISSLVHFVIGVHISGSSDCVCGDRERA